jgi:hypothetical protein
VDGFDGVDFGVFLDLGELVGVARVLALTPYVLEVADDVFVVAVLENEVDDFMVADEVLDLDDVGVVFQFH